MSGDELAAAHFGAYYKLLKERPPDQALPELGGPRLSKGVGLVSAHLLPGRPCSPEQ